MVLDSDSNLQFGVNWSYLKSLLDIYENMLSDQHILLKSYSGCGNINRKVAYANLVSSVYIFFVSVESQFIKSKKFCSKQEEYIDILSTTNVRKDKQDFNKILKLSRQLTRWATSEGVFKTLTEKNDPSEAIFDE